MRRILLVQPDFPQPKKTKIEHSAVPIGLLKIGTYYRHSEGLSVKLVRGNKPVRFRPDEVLVTSLFTYWSKHVKESVDYYKSRFPRAKIIVGGIYASLMPDHCRQNTHADVHVGLHNPAEEWCKHNPLDYSLLDEDIDFQILHGMRGCFRRCKFCGTWKIEPRMTFDRDVAKRVTSNHVIFYDNNFLKNRHIRDILRELSSVRIGGNKVRYECQSGFDGRILDDELACLLKKAGFVNPRIAWDNSYDDWRMIRRQIRMLENAGYRKKDIYVFVLYNWEHPYKIVEKKRKKCWDFGVQIADCRFRPLDQTHDDFNAHLNQTNSDYHIHEGWTDHEVKLFRKNVRRHNICIRHGFEFHSKILENKKVPRSAYRALNKSSKKEIRKQYPDAWWPDEIHLP
jgi:hypothetical protein